MSALPSVNAGHAARPGQAPANVSKGLANELIYVALAAIAGLGFVFLPIEGAMLCAAAVVLLSCCSCQCPKNLPNIFAKSTNMSPPPDFRISGSTPQNPTGYRLGPPPRERIPVIDPTTGTAAPPLPMPAQQPTQPMPHTFRRNYDEQKGLVSRGTAAAERYILPGRPGFAARERW